MYTSVYKDQLRKLEQKINTVTAYEIKDARNGLIEAIIKYKTVEKMVRDGMSANRFLPISSFQI
ncbi:hypothetical protein K040078D81_36410 [Blautia hominis]|uniref:Uncharacterized protein n=1 Tax=Blautia hominis TaxID=2025493 RepID=A0ABQ0BDM8_9FIRM